jgi:hypothetical protein
MSKDTRNPTSYLTDDWGLSKDPDQSDLNVPYQSDVPSPEWGGQSGVDEGAGGGYGHSSDVEVTDGAKGGMSKDDLARGFAKGERYDDGQYNQDIPARNEWDRGAGSETRAKEFTSTEGRGFDGRGHDKPSPGREAMGSSTLVG